MFYPSSFAPHRRWLRSLTKSPGLSVLTGFLTRRRDSAQNTLGIRVNLLPWREILIRKRMKYGSCLLIITLTGLILSTQGCRILIQRTNQQRIEQISHWQVASQKGKKFLKDYQLAQQENNHLDAELKKINEERDTVILWKNFIDALEILTPNPLWLSSLKKNEKELEITGMSRDVNSVITLRHRLISQSLFSEIHQGEINRTSEGLYRFYLHAVINTHKTEKP